MFVGAAALPLVVLLHTFGGGGILAGFLHPLLGIEHLLAMLAIGFLSAQIGGRAIWTVPAAFVVTMALGSVWGILGLPLPLVQYSLTGSVVILGIGILAHRNLPEWIGMAVAAFFGLFHGFAHGVALPELSSTLGLIIAYVAGFLVSTAGLHVIGALIGMIAIRSDRGKMLVRAFGGVMAVIGVILVLRL